MGKSLFTSSASSTVLQPAHNNLLVSSKQVDVELFSILYNTDDGERLKVGRDDTDDVLYNKQYEFIVSSCNQ